MRLFISKIEDVFQIAERGCVVVPGIPESGEFVVKPGDPILLIRPDGTELTTIIQGLELFSTPATPGLSVLLGKEITEAQVPAGTELWLEREQA